MIGNTAYMEEKQMGTNDRAKAYMELSTERLQELLRQDALGTGIRLNLEDILCITGILAQRELENPGETVPDVDTSWKQFEKRYLT